MTAPFEISSFQALTGPNPRWHGDATFLASTTKRITFAAIPLSVVMTTTPFDSHNKGEWQRLVFVGAESSRDEMTAALGADYKVQSGLLQRLDVLRASLGNNWNGEDGYPVEDKAYDNAKAAILSTPGGMLRHWRLFPNPNGTLLLSPKDKAIAGVSIGNDEFSYAAFVSDDKQISGKEPFDVLAFKAALKQIHRILGYD